MTFVEIVIFFCGADIGHVKFVCGNYNFVGGGVGADNGALDVSVEITIFSVGLTCNVCVEIL